MNWNKIVVQDNGCWLWTGAVDKYGYGKAWHNGKMYLAHRAVWEELVGPIQETLDHVKDKCSSKACCNPEHMEDVSQSENTLRGKANRDRCPQGHQYTEVRTHTKSGRTYRHCQQCNNEASHRYRKKKVA